MDIDSPAIATGRSIYNAITQSAIAERSASFARSIFQPIEQTSLGQRASYIYKSFYQSMAASFANSMQSTKTVFSSVQFSFNSAVSNSVSIQRSLANQLSFNSIASRVLFSVRTIYQSINENLISVIGRAYDRLTTSQLSVSPTASRINAMVKSISSGISLNTLAGRFYSLSRSATLQIGQSSVASRALSAFRAVYQSLSLSLVRTMGSTQSATASLGISISESLSRMLSAPRITSVQVSVNSIASRIASFSKSAYLSLSTMFNSAMGRLYERVASQQFSGSSVVSKAYAFQRAIGNQLPFSSIASRMSAMSGSIYTSISVNAVASRVSALSRSLYLSVSESFQSLSQATKTAYASLSATFSHASSRLLSVTRVALFVHPIYQQISQASASSRALSALRLLYSQLSFNVLKEKVLVIQHSVSGAFNLNALSQRFSAMPRYAYNSITSTFSRAVQATKTAVSSLGVSLNTGISRLASSVRSLRSSLDITEAQLKFSSAFRSFYLAISNNAMLSRAASIPRALVNVISQNSVVRGAFQFVRLPYNKIQFSHMAQRVAQLNMAISRSLSFNAIASKTALTLRSSVQSVSAFFQRTYQSTKIAYSSLQLSFSQAPYRIISAVKSIGSQLSVNSASIRITSIARSIYQSIAASMDSLFGRLFNFSLAQQVTESSLSSRALSATRSLPGQFSLSPVAGRIGSLVRRISSAIGVNAVSSRMAFAVRSIYSSLSASFGRFIEITKNAFPRVALNFNQIPSRSLVAGRSIASGMNINAAFLKAAQLYKKAYGTVTLNANIAFQKITLYFANAFQSFNVNSLIDRAINRQRHITSPISVSGFVSRVSYLSFRFTNIMQFLLSGKLPPPPSAPEPTGPSVSAPSGEIVSGSPITEPPKRGNIIFTSQPALTEVIAGDSAALVVEVKNIGNGSATAVLSMEGLPVQWVSIQPPVINLGSMESGRFVVNVIVQKNANPGDYQASAGIVGYESAGKASFILRVKEFPREAGIVTTRNVKVDGNHGRSTVTISVRNGNERLPRVDIVEDIKKSIANSTDYIEFEQRPDEIIRKDPVVRWSIIDMQPNTTRSFSYKVVGSLKEYSPYIYWPVNEIRVRKTKIPEGLSLSTPKALEVSPGKTKKSSFVIENAMNETRTLSVRFGLPAGWSYASRKNITLQPGESREIEFSVQMPEQAYPGYYTGMVIVDADGFVLMREYQMAALGWKFPLEYLALPFAGAAIYLVAKRLRARKKKWSDMKRKVRRMGRALDE
ncbi:MAG: hypothetical protein HZB68_00045 [Candidatus Aenigmarchaeota archaeon]|nr:hypothetical protein [Candidatus Aenigmarchaeota archaeon]